MSTKKLIKNLKQIIKDRRQIALFNMSIIYDLHAEDSDLTTLALKLSKYLQSLSLIDNIEDEIMEYETYNNIGYCCEDTCCGS